MSRRPCKDCLKPLSEARAKTRKQRCYRCEQAVKREALERAHDAYVCKTYGLKPGQYKKLYDAQGGVCYICQRATGKARRLAVDHDHACCPTTPTCGKCNRGLLCKPCNRLLGHARDSVTFFNRGAVYLNYPPAQDVLYGGLHGKEGNAAA